MESPQPTARERLRDIGFVVVVALLALLPGLGRRDHWTSAEARGPLIARELLREGELFPPRLLGEPYVNKPPGFHVATATSFAVLGESEFSARLVSVIGAIITLAALFLMSSSAGTRRDGFGAVVFLGACGIFFFQARSAELETLLAAFTTLCCLGIERGRSSPRAGALCFVAAFLATLVKGPVVALLFPSAFAAALVWSRRSSRGIVRPWAWALAGCAAAVLAYYVPLVASGTDSGVLLERALFSNVGHVRPWSYYVAKLPLTLCPALVLVLLGPATGDRPRSGLERAGAAAFALGLLGLSIFPSKQSHYLLPVLPLLALWGGPLTVRLLVGRPGRVLAWAAGLGAVFVGVVALALSPSGDLHVIAGCGTAILGGILCLVAALRRRVGAPRRPAALLVATLLVGIWTVETTLGSAGASVRSSAETMARFNELAGDGPVSYLGSNLAAAWYLDRSDLVTCRDVQAAEAFLAAHPEGFLIVKATRSRPFPQRLSAFVVKDERKAADGGRRWVLVSGRRRTEGRGT